MNIDKFIKMGHSHTLFEDAVIAKDGTAPYLIVCDGCSDSESTHIGSHLLARSAQVELEMNDGLLLNNYAESIIFRARSMADVMGLAYSSLDATLLIAFIEKDKIKVKIFGDGCVYYSLNGEKHIHKLSYFENMPYYLSYQLNHKRNIAYKTAAKKAFDNSISLKKMNHWTNDELESTEVNLFNPIELELNMEQLDYLILSTDGVESFDNDSFDKITEVDKGLHDFKNFNGEFLQRRVKRIIKSESKEGRHNMDDLGMAAIYLKGDL